MYHAFLTAFILFELTTVESRFGFKKNDKGAPITEETIKEMSECTRDMPKDKPIRLTFKPYETEHEIEGTKYILYGMDYKSFEVQTKWQDLFKVEHTLKKENKEIIQKEFKALFFERTTHRTIGVLIPSDKQPKKSSYKLSGRVNDHLKNKKREHDDIMNDILSALASSVMGMWFPKSIVTGKYNIVKKEIEVELWWDLVHPQNKHRIVQSIADPADPMRATNARKLLNKDYLDENDISLEYRNFERSQNRRRRLMDEPFSGTMIFNDRYAMITTVVLTIGALITSFFYLIV